MSSSEAWRRRLVERSRRWSLRCSRWVHSASDEQAEAVLEAELGELGVAELALQSLGQGG